MTYYLDPEFEPKKLTKAELRSIMANHGILELPPPTAKKDELLDLFYREIISKKESIIETRKSVKPKSDGIVFLDESSRPSPKKPRSPTKKSIANKTLAHSSEHCTISEEIERPSTPTAIVTSRLVSRFNSLDSETPKRSKNSFNLSLRRFIFTGLIAFTFTIYFYFKFWFNWKFYTSSELLSLVNPPLLYLSCPYSSDSLIGSCSDGKLYCSNGYIERKYPICFGSYCALDKERLGLIQAMKKRIVFELQARLGYSKCLGNISSEMSKNELYSTISKYFINMKPKLFAEYFDVCIKSLLHDGTKISSDK